MITARWSAQWRRRGKCDHRALGTSVEAARQIFDGTQINDRAADGSSMVARRAGYRAADGSSMVARRPGTAPLVAAHWSREGTSPAPLVAAHWSRTNMARAVMAAQWSRERTDTAAGGSSLVARKTKVPRRHGSSLVAVESAMIPMS